MEKLGAAIIGCGAIFKTHADAILKADNSSLVCVVDIDDNKAKTAAESYGCRYFTDYKEMLKQDDVDVVHICTPHYLHAQMAIDAMKSGKHVLTEKPIAIRVSDALEMASVSKETGKCVGVAFQNRYNTTSERIKELLASSKLGRVLGGKAFVTWFRDEDYYRNSSWRGIWDKEGGGLLINQAIHTLDLLQWFFGDIKSISGMVDTRKLRGVIEVEDTAEALINFENRVSVLFYATNCYPVNSPVQIEIVCEEAVIKLCGELTIEYKDGAIERVADVNKLTGEKSYWGCGHQALISDYYNCLTGGKPFMLGAEEGLKALKMVQGIYASSRTGKEIQL